MKVQTRITAQKPLPQIWQQLAPSCPQVLSNTATAQWLRRRARLFLARPYMVEILPCEIQRTRFTPNAILRDTQFHCASQTPLPVLWVGIMVLNEAGFRCHFVGHRLFFIPNQSVWQCGILGSEPFCLSSTHAIKSWSPTEACLHVLAMNGMSFIMETESKA